MRLSEKGQSLVEYLLMLAAVIGIVVATAPYLRGFFWSEDEGDARILSETRDKLSEEHLRNGSWNENE